MFRLTSFENEELRPYLHGYIIALTRTPGLSQEQIARRLCVDKSSVARALAVLEKMEYVERRRSDSDRRITLVYPTEKAFEAMSAINEIVNECNTYFLSALNPCERDEFVRMLGKLELRASEYYNERGDGE